MGWSAFVVVKVWKFDIFFRKDEHIKFIHLFKLALLELLHTVQKLGSFLHTTFFWWAVTKMNRVLVVI